MIDGMSFHHDYKLLRCYTGAIILREKIYEINALYVRRFTIIRNHNKHQQTVFHNLLKSLDLIFDGHDVIRANVRTFTVIYG